MPFTTVFWTEKLIQEDLRGKLVAPVIENDGNS
jgi:hypothetical protein